MELLNDAIQMGKDAALIENMIKSKHINVGDFSVVKFPTLCHPLREGIKIGRKDICLVLLKHGALAMACDCDGFVFEECIRNNLPGNLSILTTLLETLSKEECEQILKNSSIMKHVVGRRSQTYLIKRGLQQLPREKLVLLGLPRLNKLIFRIIGQNFAVEVIMRHIACHFVEAKKKPLVMLFAGTPGHGKTESAIQIADLLNCKSHVVDCRNHADPWEMFGSGT